MSTSICNRICRIAMEGLATSPPREKEVRYSPYYHVWLDIENSIYTSIIHDPAVLRLLPINERDYAKINAKLIAKCDGFKRMIADALDGQIGLILTKSVSRFARNTIDSLTTVRQPKEKGIEIYFEKENRQQRRVADYHHVENYRSALQDDVISRRYVPL